MTMVNKLFLKSSIIGNDRFVDFGDGEQAIVENSLPAELVKDLEIPPSGWWRRWGDLKGIDIDKEGIGDTIITESIIRKHLGHLYVRHFLLGDVEAEPADIELLNKQAKKLGVADIPYNFPKYDCEDRSFACMGAWHLNARTAAMATYITWVSYVKGEKKVAHALNAVCTEKAFFYYEPATYTFFKIPDFWMLNVLMG